MFFGRASNALAPLAAAGQQAVSCRGAEGRDSLMLYPLTVRLCLNVYQTVGLLVLLLHLLMGKSLNLALKHLCKVFLINLSMLFFPLHYDVWDH